MVDHQVTVRKWTPNNALGPTGGSVSVFMQIEFTESFSYRGHAAPAVGQLESLGPMEKIMNTARTYRLATLVLILGCTAACDQASKHLARARLSSLHSITLPGGVGELRLAENLGSFLSLGTSLPHQLRDSRR
jgi:hypothetical protein